MSTHRPLRVVLAASGTGGHLFPALFIARGFLRAAPESQILFVGSGRPLEARVIDQNGFRRRVVVTVGLKKRGLRGVVQFLSLLPRAVAQSWRLLREEQPDIVIGVGGYASFFPVVLAALRGVPTWIHEAEVRPGLTNYVLSLVARRVSTAYRTAQMPFWARVTYTGHPINDALIDIGVTPPILHQPPRVLIMGGSQGARSLDQTLTELAPQLPPCELIHQARPESVDEVRARYQAAGVQAQVVPFIDDVPAAYRWCDLVIARSGAGTVREVAVVNRPAIFVPLPSAAGNEQLANAEALAALGKAVVCEEGSEFASRLLSTIRELLEPARYQEIASAPVGSDDLHAVKRIVEGCLRLTTPVG